MSDCIILGNRVIFTDRISEAAILIKDGKIRDIRHSIPQNFKGNIIEAGDDLVMAGIVDTHVHINEPGRTHWEGFNTATKAALSGGVTTLVDMPLNSSPVTTTVAALHQKIAAANNQLHANCGFWGGLVPGNTDEIEGLIKAGVLGFKAFLTHSGIDDFPNVTEDDLHKAMPIIAKYNLPLLVHCELSEDNAWWKEKDTTVYQNYLQSRPQKWEDDAIALMIRLCEQYKCKVHIVHLSSANSIAQIQSAKERGLPLTVETAQHYLYFNAEDIPDGATQYKCAPPIRSKANNELLWKALQEGIIDFVATDHSPAPPEIKELETGDFSKAWGGIASIQFALPVLWTAAMKHGCTPQQISMWLCGKPAQLAGVNKGKIAVGYDADFIIWNENGSFTVEESAILYRHKVSPYMHQQLYGVTKQTIISGEIVYKMSSFLKLNNGQIITPRLSVF